MVYIDDLLGIPYRVNGTDKKGFDCKGLVVKIENRLGRKIDKLEPSRNWIKTQNLKEGDVILFYDSNGRVFHCGAYLDNGNFIQCNCFGVNIDNLKNCRNHWEAYTWQS